MRSDHPRSRGEYVGLPPTCGQRVGSSPLSRGIHLRDPKVLGGNRIIPALAGNTLGRSQSNLGRRDHPRSRGEYISTSLAEDYRAGSSPLSRGIPPRAGEHQPLLRIIPALVGKTPTKLAAPPSAQDHPRSRGEYYGLGFSTRSPEGSSPLSRGIRRQQWRGGQSVGIIPALAGNTL